MAENLTTTTEVDPAVAIFYDRVLLKRGVPYLVHDVAAQRRNIPQKRGNTIKFRRYSALAVATTPLQEGVTPPGSQLAKTDLTAKVSQYGDFIHITDIVDLTVEDAVLTETAELLGEQMGETMDTLIRDILAACASATISSETAQILTDAEIQAIVQALITNKARMITGIVKASTGIGTTPIRPAFLGIMHSGLIDDLENETNVPSFIPTNKYPAQQPVMEAEWGATKNVRWLITQNGYNLGAGSAGDPTYKLMILGRNAYGMTVIDGSSLKNIVKAFGSGGTTDPLNQRATSGWKNTFVCRILNDNFMHILRVNHTA